MRYARDLDKEPVILHTRMPIALSKESESSWLDASLTDAVKAIQFARNRSDTEFVYRTVNPRVNNSRSEGAELIKPFETPA
jgi:putative SOS response-associated peptidase YedK